MLITLKPNGVAEIVTPIRLFRGTNVIQYVVLSPYPSNIPISISFTSPSGKNSGYLPMTPVAIPSEYSNKGLSAWLYSDDLGVGTSEVGTAYINFSAILPIGETSGNQTSFMCEYTIEETALPTLPEEPSQDVYTLLLQYMAKYAEDIENINETAEEAVQKANDAFEKSKNAEANSNTAKYTAYSAAYRAQQALDESNRKRLLDFTVNPNTGVGTKYFSDGTTATVQFPIGGETAGEVVGTPLTSITFLASQFVNGELAITPMQTGYNDSNFIIAVEALQGDGYIQTANNAFKGSDGSVLLSYNVAFDGRILLFGAGKALQGKQGIQGIQGERGAQGIQGLTGPSGVTSGTVNSNEHGISQTNGYTQYAVNTLVSNPNLLINSNFAINQRGQTSYNVNSKYTVDRWRLSYGSLAINADGSVTHTVGVSDWQGIIQMIENPSRLAGKTVTLSARGHSTTSTRYITINLLRKGEAQSTQLANKYDRMSETPTTLSVTTTFPTDITDEDQVWVGLITYSKTQNATWYWAKFEYGSVATAYTIPDPATELMRCQRYYVKLNDARARAVLYGDQFSGVHFSIPLPTVLRITPTVIKGSSTIVTMLSGNYDSDFTIQYISAPTYGNTVTLRITYDGTYGDRCLNIKDMEFDAEIY